MSNQQRNKKAYLEILDTFENLSEQKISTNFNHSMIKAYHMFLGGFVPNRYPSSDFGKNMINNLLDYSKFMSHRRKIKISGAIREVALENEAFESLSLAQKIAKDLMCPFFKEKNEMSNKVFNDIHFLGLAYVHAIVNGVADGYIESKVAYESKCNSINIAKEGLRVYDLYKEKGFSNETKIALKNLEKVLEHSSENLLRSFELVPTDGKKIYKKDYYMNKLKENIVKDINSFEPDVVVPIAHGGTELGIKISNVLEDNGHSSVTYPLLYSIKTRKHRSPWTEYDSEFLSNNLEGKNFLITEDWVTTGNTLRGILLQLEQNYPKEIRVATIKKDKEKTKNISFLDNYHFYVGENCIYQGNKTDSLL